MCQAGGGSASWLAQTTMSGGRGEAECMVKRADVRTGKQACKTSMQGGRGHVRGDPAKRAGVRARKVCGDAGRGARQSGRVPSKQDLFVD